MTPEEQLSSLRAVPDIVRLHGTNRPNHPALVQGDTTITWSGLYERAGRVANYLASCGVGSQDRIALLDKNSLEHFEIFFGAGLLNAVTVSVNWRLAAPEVEYIVNDAEAKVLIVGREFLPVLKAIDGSLPTVTHILVIEGADGYTDYRTAVDVFDSSDPAVPAGSDDVAFQLYSSGTTGRPKGVMLSNANFLAGIPLSRDGYQLDADSVNMVAMPLFHIGGGGWAMCGMLHGCTSVIVREVDPTQLIKVIERHRITHAFLVPAVLQFMLQVPGVEQADYSSLRIFLYGASPISEDVLKRSIRMFGCTFLQAYGSTETTGTIVLLPGLDHDPDGPNKHRLRSCGLPIPGVQVRVVDTATGTDTPVREVGEIWIKGPQVMQGYWHMPDETAKSIVDGGWFRSGDAGYFDEDGYLYIHDRVKDMIVSGGENVYPAEVENALMGHPDIADVAVIAVPHDRWGETPKAMVVRAAGSTISEQDVIDYARERLARYKCPTSVDCLDALPRNPSGKILKKDLRAPFWAGRDRMVN